MDRDSVKKRIKDLRDEIEYHNKLYYDDNQNIISDYEYDLKMNELISLEKQYPEYLLNTSPSLKVGGKITKEIYKPVWQFDNRWTCVEGDTRF